MDKIYIGTDEVGNGSTFGGLAVVGFLLWHLISTTLCENSVWGPKTLTGQRFRQIAPIKEKSSTKRPPFTERCYRSYRELHVVSVKVALHQAESFSCFKRSSQSVPLMLLQALKTMTVFFGAGSQPFSKQDHFWMEEKAEATTGCYGYHCAWSLPKTWKNLGRESGYQLPSGAGTASDKVASKNPAVVWRDFISVPNCIF